MKQLSSQPRIGLALGGGGARGLAHIAMLEVFDELGIKPAVISGTSIGAIYGAAYASGVPAIELREHTRTLLSQRLSLVRDFFASRPQPLQRLLGVFSHRAAVLDPVAVMKIILPKGTKSTFADLSIPLKLVASDFYDQEAVILSDGPLFQAVAASMALPALFQPVLINNRVLIDGGLTNPLPFDLLTNDADLVIAIDVSGAPTRDPARPLPNALETLFASAFLFERSIVREKLKAAQPDVLIRGGTSQFQVLDFLKFDAILAASEPAKDQLKRQIDRLLSVDTLAIVDNDMVDTAAKTAVLPTKRRRDRFLRRSKKV